MHHKMLSCKHGAKRMRIQNAASSKAAEPEGCDYHSDSDCELEVENLGTDRQKIARCTAEEYARGVKLVGTMTLIAERSPNAATLPQILRALRPMIRGIPRYPQTMFEGPWLINPIIIHDDSGTTVGAFWNRDLESAIQANTPPEHAALQDVKLDLHVGRVPLAQLASPYFNAWVMHGMLYENTQSRSKPFLLNVFCGDGKPRAQDFLRPICEQVTELRKTRTVKVRAVLVGPEAHSFVKETVSHSTYYGCPQCIIKGKYIHNCVSFTNGDEPEVNHSKYESPSRKHAEFMTSVYDKTHRVAEEPNMYPLQPLGIDMIKDVLIADERHLLHLGAVKTFFTTFTEGGYNVQEMDQENFDMLKTVLLNTQFPYERNYGPFGKIPGKWSAEIWGFFTDVAGYVALQASLSLSDFKMYSYLYWGVQICNRTRQEKYLTHAHRLFATFVRDWDKRVGIVPYCIHGLLHIVDEVRNKGPLRLNSTHTIEEKIGTLRHYVDTHDIPRALGQLVTTSMLHEQAMPPPLSFTRPIITNNGRRVILRKNFLLRSEGISSKDKDSWFLASNNRVIKFEQAVERGIDCTIVGRPLEKPATLSYEHAFPVPDGTNAYTSDKDGKLALRLSEEQEYHSSEIVCKLAVIHMELFATFMPLIESFANEA